MKRRLQFSLRTWLIVSAVAAIYVGLGGRAVWEEVKLAMNPQPPPVITVVPDPQVQPIPPLIVGNQVSGMSHARFAFHFLEHEPMPVSKLFGVPLITIRDDSVLLTYECPDGLCNIAVDREAWERGMVEVIEVE